MNGMDLSCTAWLFHGEQEPILEQHDYANMTKTYHMYRDVLNFKQKVEDVEALLYEGCTEYTKLSATLVVYKTKASIDATNKLLDKLVQALKDMFLVGNTLSNSMNLTKKLLKLFDLGFEKIDACVNDCCSLWKTLNKLKCGSSRWQVFMHFDDLPGEEMHSSDDVNETKERKGKSPTMLDYTAMSKFKQSGVQFNDKGQHFGAGSMSLIPATYSSWDEVLQNYDLAGHKKAILTQMFGCWRTYKATLTKQIRALDDGLDAMEQMQLLKLANVEEQADWEKFLQCNKKSAREVNNGSR
ncbi:hypothetical protein D8674_000309 [Pyrus ussuriensis x Pyrus communis]|uniref:Uncharacterized protein n=1 Tax=Pyrus ussuriensis x Pyrus communis TaxID=2448454 RepID=A0A5N5F2S6_9ROSA|nr:hypothetical protein D8674_000309 [Pyrus ussuriensis x Pyrus communis]